MVIDGKSLWRKSICISNMRDNIAVLWMCLPLSNISQYRTMVAITIQTEMTRDKDCLSSLI